ncbi:CNNM domain-containing protein [Georgenia alba]|uniref:CNNM domain-containing protein n=1 Tax=Georgenia alba TaxID=2233858 RepID=A0ABW2Q6L9_9MICO
MSDPLAVVAATVLLLALSAFFVVIEFALLGARQHKLEADATRSRSARAALRGIHELTIMLAVAQLGITACTFALGAVTKPAVDAWLGPVLASWGAPGWLADGAAFVLSLVLVTFLHLVVGEMTPKSWAIAHPELAAKLIGVPSRSFAWTFRPLLNWVNGIANRLVAASGITPVDRAGVGGRDPEAIRQLVEHSASVGALDDSFRNQIASILDLDRITLADLITGKGRPTSVPEGATVADVQAAATRSGHMRMLVEQPGGAVPRQVHVRDTLPEPPERQIAQLTRPVLALDGRTPVYEALARMRTTSEQLAVVTDHGQFVGLVTIADILRRVLPHQHGTVAAVSRT